VKASDYIADFLAARGVGPVFEMPGGMTPHPLDPFHHRGEIDIVSMHHEQAAAFASEAGARVTGIPGVALATSGPGATNLITGIGSCFYDSVPAVFITGQVNTTEQRGESGVRQSGFQETDIVAVVAPITKAAWRVQDADDLPRLLAEAFRVALSGRMGPVLLDIAMDVQRAQIEPPEPLLVAAGTPLAASAETIDRVRSALASAERPLILAGGAIRSEQARHRLAALARSWQLPVVTSLLGVDAIAGDDPLRVGMIGTYGNRWANEALGRCDVLLVVGSRLDNRQTGADVDRFAQGKTIIRVDIDASEISWRVRPQIAVVADASEFLGQLLQAEVPELDRSAWLAEVATLRAAAPDEAEISDVPGINAARLMHVLSDAATDASAIATDVGQNQMWAAQSLCLRDGQRLLTSGGMGAMGFSLPAAIGAALAVPGRPVVAITGDGGMQVNIQELETVFRLGLPIKIVVLDNGCLGMVRQFQEEYFESCYQSTVWGYGSPDFAAVAKAYGIPARLVESEQELEAATAWLMSDAGSPALLHVRLAQDTRVRPKVAFGNPIFVMEPAPGADTGGGSRDE